MRAEIICIGTELLLGDIINTNAAFLSQHLSAIGIDLYHHTTVGDNPGRLFQALKDALGRADIVITSGGLGPTVDDITVDTVARLLGRRVILDPKVLKDVKAYFTSRRIPFPRASERQARVPVGIPWIRNTVGSAPGLIAETGGKVIICLPGPPREIQAMFKKDVLPYLQKRVQGPGSRVQEILKTRTIKLAGGAESRINDMVEDLLRLAPPTTVGIYAKLGEVHLKIMTKVSGERNAAKAIAKIERKIRARAKAYIFGCDDETLESVVGAALRKKKLTIAVAESCTGGLLANRLTNVSGSSDYFHMGIIAYSNKVKVHFLDVREEDLKRHGAVSKEVAIQMARGSRLLAGTHIGVGITGIAGPTGGTKKKPVGLVYIAVVTPKKEIVKECRFRGSREEIKFLSSQAALNLIRKNV